MKQYCMNCGKVNNSQASTSKTKQSGKKCKFCGQFLTSPTIVAPLQKPTSKDIYKNAKSKGV